MIILFIPKKLSRHYDLGADLAVFANYKVLIIKTCYVQTENNNNLKPNLTITITLDTAVISKIRLMH